jgi:hypothetical protein
MIRAQQENRKWPSLEGLRLQVFACGDKGVETGFLDQSQQLSVLHGSPALDGHGRYRVAGKVIASVSAHLHRG